MRNFAISVLIVIVTVALLLAFPNGKAEAQEVLTFSVSRDILYLDETVLEHEPIHQSLPSNLVGRSCSVSATVENNESDRSGNSVSVRAGHDWIDFSNVEGASYQVSSSSRTTTIGSTLSVVVNIPSGTFSARVTVNINCEGDVEPPAIEVPEPPESPGCDLMNVNGGLYNDGVTMTGTISNTNGSDCYVTLFRFGSYDMTPHDDDWLYGQEPISQESILVPANSTIEISRQIDQSWCHTQDDLVRTTEYRNPPFYSGDDMIAWTVARTNNPCDGTTPPPTPPPPTGNPLPPAGKNCDAIGGLPVGNYMGIGIEHVENGHPTNLEELFSLGYVNEEGFALPFDARYKGVIAIIPVTDVEIDTAATAIEYFDTNTCSYVSAPSGGVQTSQVVTYGWDCTSQELYLELHDSRTEDSDFVLSYIVDDPGIPVSPTNVTQQLDDVFGGPIDIAESYYDPFNCKIFVTARLRGTNDNYQLIMVRSYGTSTWSHVVTEPEEDVHLVGVADDWVVVTTVDDQLVTMNQWGREREEFDLTITEQAVLHPNGDDIFFVASSGVTNFDIVDEIQVDGVLSSEAVPLGFSPDGTQMAYLRDGYVYIVDITEEVRRNSYVGNPINDIVFDEDDTGNGSLAYDGQQTLFFNNNVRASTFSAQSVDDEIQESIIVQQDWSDWLKRIIPQNPDLEN